MSEMIVPRTEIIKDTDAILHIREEVIKDKIDSVFSKLSLLDYRMLKRVWPEIGSSEKIPEEKVFLQTIQGEFGIPMSRISQTVESMNNKGLIDWKRAESGTYIQVTDRGFSLFCEQQEILFSYIGRVVKKVGIERMHEIVQAMNDLEEALNSEMP